MATITRRTLFNYIRLRRYSQVSQQLKFKKETEAILYRRQSNFRNLYHARALSTEAEIKVSEEQPRNTGGNEKISGPSESREFQAETRMLLDIVANSLYSNKEVFVRELVSNASDALEKLRYVTLTENPNQDTGPLEIRIFTDKQNRILTIQDNGIGMTREELISNLGTIARSGSKAFLEEHKNKSADTSAIIGQFGVGFYSCFMVADKVEVFTQSTRPDTKGCYWVSDGSGMYQIQEADEVSRGTKIVIHLKATCREYADGSRIKDVIKKYSNFVNCSVYVDGNLANTMQPLWLVDPKSVTPEQHNEFYSFIANAYDKPRFVMHYKTDAPVTIRALLYVPSVTPVIYDLNQESGVALYTRRVLIKSKAEEILPKWCKFIKGIVDCEDIPLNLSRELLQNSPLIAKLRSILTTRIVKFLSDKAAKEPEAYAKFYEDYNLFLKSGVVFSDMREDREEVAKLLRYETSKTKLNKPNETISLIEYCGRMQEDQKDIFYLSAPNRALAETSPYLEALQKKDVEVIFCYEMYDERVLLQLNNFRNKNIVSVEKQMREDKDTSLDLGQNTLNKTEIDSLVQWAEKELKNKATSVKITNKLNTHPCVVTVEEMAGARSFLRSKSHQLTDEMRCSLIQPRLELNPKHPIVKKLSTLVDSNPQLASLLIKQLFSNAMMVAGLVEDPCSILAGMNQLLTLALEKH